jgi:hypothetical protein
LIEPQRVFERLVRGAALTLIRVMNDRGADAG